MPLLPPENLDNRFTNELPGDHDKRNFPRQVFKAFWSEAAPTPVSAPRLVAYAPAVASLLDLSHEDAASREFLEVFSGNRILPGMKPYAACYGGHQFGSWAGQLGDGRAIGLGEYVNRAGQRWEFQLKGAGITPYSRTADGRAVLRSSLREFLCSEAMHHLGVPTTRALSLVTTGEPVIRDVMYDGHPRPEPGAVVCRVAPSFIRFGNFEIFTARNDTQLTETLIDFTISRDFPEIKGTRDLRRIEWFHEVCRRTAKLMVDWMRVGFVHGVMNTDNMSILGLTIDYGPYGWVDDYDPLWTPNTTDAHGRRYAFARQPGVAHWNLACLAEALAPVFPSVEELRSGLELYKRTFTQSYQAMIDAKFGFGAPHEANSLLAEQAFELMHQSQVDMTCFFRDLAQLDLAHPHVNALQNAFYDNELKERFAGKWEDWLTRYARHCAPMAAENRASRMNAINPRYVPRNYLAQEAIDLAEQGDASRLLELMKVLETPYTEQTGRDKYAQKRPDWARHKVGCSMLSCSS